MEPWVGSLSAKKILIGVTGGIAAYKSAELVRLLMAEHAKVRVVMTRSAKSFVGPVTFQALTGYPVRSDVFDSDDDTAMEHIQLARWADCIVIAPATADFIAKLRLGLADDLLSTVCLAAQCPLVIAPAMNRVMWSNPATQENVKVLAERGVHQLEPESGLQACGEDGVGRMVEPNAICSSLASLFAATIGPLSGLSVLVSAGPTREAIDPVRYISNRSSGRMGYEIAAAAVSAGAKVTLVSGPVSLSPPPEIDQFIAVQSAAEMFSRIMEIAHQHQIYIGTAAVADYTPIETGVQKIKKNNVRLELSLQRTQDILARIAALDPGPFTVGFAAETDNLEHYAKQKLKSKKLDMIVANQVGVQDLGFDSDQNALSVFWNDGRIDWGPSPKKYLAGELIQLVAERYQLRGGKRDS